jgi:hypothetical protein
MFESVLMLCLSIDHDGMSAAASIVIARRFDSFQKLDSGFETLVENPSGNFERAQRILSDGDKAAAHLLLFVTRQRALSAQEPDERRFHFGGFAFDAGKFVSAQTLFEMLNVYF